MALRERLIRDTVTGTGPLNGPDANGQQSFQEMKSGCTALSSIGWI